MTWKTRAAAVVLAIVAIGIVPTIYSVQTTPREAQLIWKGNEAYMVIGVASFGWRRSPFRVLFDRLIAQYGAATPKVRRSSVLFRITATTVDQHVTEDVKPTPILALADGQITDRWSRWTGARFEPLSADQNTRLKAFPTDDFSNVDGWSGRRFLTNSPDPSGRRIPFTLGEAPMAVIIFGQGYKWAVIDLQRGDLPPERLWSLDGRSRFVGMSEYLSLFGP